MVFMKNNGIECEIGDDAIFELVEKTKNKEWNLEQIRRWFKTYYIEV